MYNVSVRLTPKESNVASAAIGSTVAISDPNKSESRRGSIVTIEDQLEMMYTMSLANPMQRQGICGNKAQ
eukprot:8407655-Ditylum_brightwellii.AAC.1